MDVKEYIKERLDPQIEWYSKKSKHCQKLYKTIQIIEIILAATIPLLSGYSDILLISITILESIAKLNKYHEYWIQYRSTCEILKYQKHIYLTSSAPYNKEDESVDNLFVRNIEQIISSENNQWKSINTKTNNK